MIWLPPSGRPLPPGLRHSESFEVTPDSPPEPKAPDRAGIGLWNSPRQWMLLVVLSIVLAAVLEVAGIPAALLMGPMIAGAIVAMNGATIQRPRNLFRCSQAIIGTMIAATITPSILPTFFDNWLLFTLVVASVITMSTLSGYVISRMNILPGSTAVWGSSAGAATSMLVMAEAYGADVRLVAFMQYLRVVFVAGAAALVARYWAEVDGQAQAIVWFETIDPLRFGETLAIAIFGGFLGKWLKLPAGIFLMPLILGATLTMTGIVTIQIPEWLLALSYAMLGWNIGLGFTRPILAHARKALVPTIVSILSLMAFSGILAFILVEAVGVDPLTAYLATSPGGMDSIAIIAASSNVDVSFVMTLQAVRLMLVMAFGPGLARFVASRTGG